MGVTLSPSSIPKLRQAIADGEAFRLSRGADRLPAGPESGSFHAMIIGKASEHPANQDASPSDMRMLYSFIRITPCGDNEADIWLNRTQPFRIVDRSATLHAALEVNARHCPSNEVVTMTFTGYSDTIETHDGQPVTVRRPRLAFGYTPPQIITHLPIHDHRDNVTGGGFAFAIYHPGTGLPQQQWGV